MEYTVPVIGQCAFDGAATYLCILGYPDDERKRRETFEACVAHRVRRYRDHYKYVGIDETLADRTRPLLERWPARDMWNCLSMLDKRLLNRRRAAELLGFYAVSKIVKPPRREHGIEPPPRHRLAAQQELRLSRDGTLTALDTLRVMPDLDTPEFKVVEGNGTQRLEPIDPSSRRAATNSDLIRIGAALWNTVPRNVARNILAPVAPVAHMALALRETILRESRLSNVIDLLTCPHWVLPAVEDAKIIERTWAANARAYPAWRKIDSAKFLDIAPVISYHCANLVQLLARNLCQDRPLHQRSRSPMNENSLSKSAIEQQIARIKSATAPDAATQAIIERIHENATAAGGFHSRPASKDAGPQPHSAAVARILFNTGKLKPPFSDETKRLLAEAGCVTEKSPELKRILANANPSALTDAERAEAFPQSPELKRVLANTAGLAGRRKD